MTSTSFGSPTALVNQEQSNHYDGLARSPGKRLIFGHTDVNQRPEAKEHCPWSHRLQDSPVQTEQALEGSRTQAGKKKKNPLEIPAHFLFQDQRKKPV